MTGHPDSPLPIHGGDLAHAEQLFGRPKDGWIDLSTGINPWPYPLPDIQPEAWSRLPSAAALDALIASAAACYGAPTAEAVVAAPGTQALIQVLPSLWPDRRVAVVGPTYGEHARCWRDGGHPVALCADPLKAAESGDIVVVTNPNNPDGRRLEPDLLHRIADDLSGRDGLLIVDEAFADLVPALSLAPDADRPARVVLRSFGKFYGLAGVRLGFAIAEPRIASRIRRALGPWAVSGPALAIGAHALADRSWADDTRRRLAQAGDRLSALLREAGLEILGGTGLFVLAAHPQAATLFEQLGRAGIFVRGFPDEPRWLRFGLPADERSEARLRAALRGG